MKIALVILHADPAKGGAERYTFDLAEALAARGHAVSLVASTFGPRPAGVECVEVGESGLTRLGRYRRFLHVIDRHVTARTYDVVHAMLPVRCDVYHPHAGLAAEAVASGHLKYAGPAKRMLARLSNRLNLKRKAFAHVEHRLLTSPEPPVVLCLSEYVKATVRRQYPRLPDIYLATLFNAVDLGKYNPTAAGDGTKVRDRLKPGARAIALMIAQDYERKGLREAIEALAKVDAAQRPTLLVVGKGKVKPYAELASDLGVGRHVVFAGSTTNPRSFYAAADFFVLPTRHDPCSLVVLEALAMGLPVISTKQNGACEIMTNGEHGFVLESADDSAGLVSAMTALCDQTVRSKMRLACLALRPRLAYETHLTALLSIYSRVSPMRDL